jgi:hypothetical protein
LYDGTNNIYNKFNYNGRLCQNLQYELNEHCYRLNNNTPQYVKYQIYNE